MVLYKCFDCKKEVPKNLVERKIRCPHCGYKVLFKVQNRETEPIKAE